MKEFRFFALMRSGHHHIINCIYSDLESVAFANNITSALWNPAENDNRYERFVSQFERGDARRPNLINIHCNIPGCSALPLIGKTTQFDVLLYNVEDDPVVSYRNGRPEPKKMLVFDPNDHHRRIGIGTGDLRDVLVLRDPYNFIASRIAFQKRINIDVLTDVVECWCVHAREYLRQTQLLDDPILINYNQWVSSQAYRKTITELFGGRFTDNQVRRVSPYGAGSSFTGMGTLPENATLFRYQQFENDAAYQRLIDNKEMAELSTEIFGDILPKPRQIPLL